MSPCSKEGGGGEGTEMKSIAHHRLRVGSDQKLRVYGMTLSRAGEDFFTMDDNRIGRKPHIGAERRGA